MTDSPGIYHWVEVKDPFEGRTSSRTGILYFAYGSNLSYGQMKSRCKDSRPVAVARLDGWRWIINSRTYANIVELPNHDTTQLSDESCVWGIVYEISNGDEKELDGWEGHTNQNDTPELDNDPIMKTRRPFKQGRWFYNKQLVKVAVTKWLVNSRLYDCGYNRGEIDVLTYVDEEDTRDGTITPLYSTRMNRAIKEGAELGIPLQWMDQIMRKEGWVSREEGCAPDGYVGEQPGDDPDEHASIVAAAHRQVSPSQSKSRESVDGAEAPEEGWKTPFPHR